MKIFLVSNLYPSNKFPAFGTFVKEFENSMVSQGAEIVCKAVIDHKYGNKFKLFLVYIFFYCKILALGLSQKYDLIYVHYIAHTSVPIWLLSFIKRKKIVLNIHGDDILPRTRLVNYFQHIIRKLLNKTDLVVVPSSFFKQIFLERFNFNENNVYIYPSGGINLKVFKRVNTLKEEFGFLENDIILGFVSRISPGKNWQLFIECVEKLNKIDSRYKGLLIGTGDETKLLTNILYKKDLNKIVYFQEHVSHKDLSKYYSTMDLFIFPSALPESLGLVGLEAMSCGTPVIGSDIGGIKTFIREGLNGYLFQPNNIEELIKKIEYYSLLPSKKKEEIVSNTLLTAKEYDSLKCTNHLYKTLKHLLTKGN